MSNDKTGGAVYPGYQIYKTREGAEVRHASHYHDGLLLIDYFAAQAMQAILTNPTGSCFDDKHRGKDLSKEALADLAYQAAEAMLAERKRRGM